jgi:predicted  nucleic acid-binding Zn-ribbon protein
MARRVLTAALAALHSRLQPLNVSAPTWRIRTKGKSDDPQALILQFGGQPVGSLRLDEFIPGSKQERVVLAAALDLVALSNAAPELLAWLDAEEPVGSVSRENMPVVTDSDTVGKWLEAVRTAEKERDSARSETGHARQRILALEEERDTAVNRDKALAAEITDWEAFYDAIHDTLLPHLAGIPENMLVREHLPATAGQIFREMREDHQRAIRLQRELTAVERQITTLTTDLEASRTVTRQQQTAIEALESDANMLRLELQHQKRMGWMVFAVGLVAALIAGLGIGGWFGGRGR